MSIAQLDWQLFQLINHGFHSPALDVFMAVLSSWVFWKPFALLAAAFTVVFGGFKGRAFLCCAVLIILIADAGVATAIKQFTNRPRPYQAAIGVRVVRLQQLRPRFLALAYSAVVTSSTLPPKNRAGRSFPSGHVTNNFALAVVLTWFYRRWGWLYFIIGTLVAWSRVYVGDHYPSDVLAAAAIGAAVALIMRAILEWLWRTHGPRLAPRLAAGRPSLATKNKASPRWDAIA